MSRGSEGTSTTSPGDQRLLHQETVGGLRWHLRHSASFTWTVLLKPAQPTRQWSWSAIGPMSLASKRRTCARTKIPSTQPSGASFDASFSCDRVVDWLDGKTEPRLGKLGLLCHRVGEGRISARHYKLVVEISELVETTVQFTRALPLFFSHIVTTREPAPPEMRLRIASPPHPGEATAIFLVRLCLNLSDACIHFATRPLTFYVAALVALFKLKTLCRGGKCSPTTDCRYNGDC